MAAVALALSACSAHTTVAEEDAPVEAPAVVAGETDAKEAEYTRLRGLLVDRHLAGRDITDERVLAAMRKVPRHRYVPEDLRKYAYRDHPLAIGHDQTISQPYIVAIMSQLLLLDGTEEVLEIGTGSGYQAAVLGELAATVHTIEIVQPLCDSSTALLQAEGYDNVQVHCGDGYQGLPDEAPFDAVMVTAAPEHVPQPLVDQLAPGGRMVIPVGPAGWAQELTLLVKGEDGKVTRSKVFGVAFVPMTGEAQQTSGADGEGE